MARVGQSEEEPLNFKRLAALGVAATAAVAVTSGAATAHSNAFTTQVVIDGYTGPSRSAEAHLRGG